MCLGVPMQVQSVAAHVAECLDGSDRHEVDIRLVTRPQTGDWLLVHLGAARQVLTPDEAQRIREALDAVRLVMQGTAPDSATLDHLFADLVDREPPLPPHLKPGHGNTDNPTS